MKPGLIFFLALTGSLAFAQTEDFSLKNYDAILEGNQARTQFLAMHSDPFAKRTVGTGTVTLSVRTKDGSFLSCVHYDVNDTVQCLVKIRNIVKQN